MEQELTPGTKLLNTFLRIMVACLVVILILIPIAGILELVGIFD